MSYELGLEMSYELGLEMRYELSIQASEFSLDPQYFL